MTLTNKYEIVHASYYDAHELTKYLTEAFDAGYRTVQVLTTESINSETNRWKSTLLLERIDDGE